MIRVLFNTNVLLDALLAREPFVESAGFLLKAVEFGTIEGFISATTITDEHYPMGRQTKSAETAIMAVSRLLASMEICPVDRAVLERAISIGLADFEDVLQKSPITVKQALVYSSIIIRIQCILSMIRDGHAPIAPNAFILAI